MLTRLLAAPFALDNSLSQQTRRQGLLTVVSWLQDQPGDCWEAGRDDRRECEQAERRWNRMERPYECGIFVILFGRGRFGQR